MKKVNWIPYIINIVNGVPLGLCPLCNNRELQYGLEKFDNNEGFGAIWCSSCKNGHRISRIKLKSISHMGDKIPRDIKFS